MDKYQLCAVQLSVVNPVIHFRLRYLLHYVSHNLEQDIFLYRISSFVLMVFTTKLTLSFLFFIFPSQF